MSSTTKAATDNDAGADNSDPYQIIKEGTVEMKYPADQESAVFYNPVQVQNRDLSILMITVAAEERAVRRAVARKRAQLRQDKVKDWRDVLRVYQDSLDPSQVLNEQCSKDEGLDIIDALAASGLRSIRYWNEIPGVRNVTINDLEAVAVERAHQNLKHNEVDQHVVLTGGDSDSGNERRPAGIRVQQGDAIHELYTSRPSTVGSSSNNKPPWDVIDLDPYGSAAPFLDASVQAIADGGLLCVTCTDMAALGGSHPETCYGRYAAMPLQRAGYLQEMALRILLQSLATTAAKYGRTITPRLSVGMNFYIRCFVTVHDDKAGVANLALSIGKVFQSTQCSSFVIVPECQMGGKKGTVFQAARAPGSCQETGANYKIGGPMWLGALHDAEWIQRGLQKLESNDPAIKPDLKYIATRDRLRGLLKNCAEELPDAPLFYKISDMASLLKTSAPPLNDIRAALMNAGYRVSGYHKDPQAIKTNAPDHVMWDILRAWCQKMPPAKPPAEGTAGAMILSKKSQIEVDFTHPKDGFPKKSDVARFPENPEAGWGPKRAAAGYKKRKIEEPHEKKDTNKEAKK